MPETDLALITRVAQEAGEIALRHFRRDVTTWDKPDGAGPVTEADLAVNAHLAEHLRAARPEYGWLSEETEDSDARLGAERLFIIDPIDGTRAFLDGARDWGISVAVVHGTRPVAAAVVMPARETTYAAALGEGATRDGAPIRVSAEAAVEQATVLTARPNLHAHHWQDGTPPPFQRSFRSSLAFRLALVAEGRFEAMLTLRPTWEWDIAAGALLVTEAGGAVTDRQTRPLRFKNADPRLSGVLAAGAVHDAIAGRLAADPGVIV